MIISRTPFRISFFGGGSDYPSWYRQHDGAVLAATIDKYCYISVRQLPPFFEHKFRVVYSKIESCLVVDKITHPALRGVLQHMNIACGLEIHHDGELMHEAWQVKRGLSDKVSNADVDALYQQAKEAGAVGGKLTGAGGGGFMLLFVPPGRKAAVSQALHHLIHVPFQFEFSGSQIIFFELEQDYSTEEQQRAEQTVAPFRELNEHHMHQGNFG